MMTILSFSPCSSPMHATIFRDYTWGIEAIPADYEQLKSDLYFLTSLKVNIKNEEGTLFDLREGNQAIRELLPRLDETLSSYQKGN